MAEIDICLQDIGNRITELRKRLGWTQEELAEKADLTPQFVSYAESGKRAMRPENLLKLSKALNVSADYLLTGEIIDKDLLILSDKIKQLSECSPLDLHWDMLAIEHDTVLIIVNIR